MNEEVKQWYYKIYTKGKSILIFTFIVLLTIIGFKLAYFYLPFLIAFTISLIIEPIIKKLMKKFKISRKFSSIIVLIFTLGIIIGFLSWIIITLISESSNLLSNFNVYYEKISSGIGKWLNNTNIERNVFSDSCRHVDFNPSLVYSTFAWCDVVELKLLFFQYIPKPENTSSNKAVGQYHFFCLVIRISFILFSTQI